VQGARMTRLAIGAEQGRWALLDYGASSCACSRADPRLRARPVGAAPRVALPEPYRSQAQRQRRPAPTEGPPDAR
jgi:hypothetical protein